MKMKTTSIRTYENELFEKIVDLEEKHTPTASKTSVLDKIIKEAAKKRGIK